MRFTEEYAYVHVSDAYRRTPPPMSLRSFATFHLQTFTILSFPEFVISSCFAVDASGNFHDNATAREMDFSRGTTVSLFISYESKYFKVSFCLFSFRMRL